jgi:hypothetical protein
MLANGRQIVVDNFNKVREEQGICAAYGAVFDRPSWGEGLKRLIPDYMWNGMVHYMVFGDRPGDFLSAVLRNDLMGALKQADSVNMKRIDDYGAFLYNYAPAGSFGSEEHFSNWIAHRGCVGPEEA